MLNGTTALAFMAIITWIMLMYRWTLNDQIYSVIRYSGLIVWIDRIWRTVYDTYRSLLLESFTTPDVPLQVTVNSSVQTSTAPMAVLVLLNLWASGANARMSTTGPDANSVSLCLFFGSPFKFRKQTQYRQVKISSNLIYWSSRTENTSFCWS